MPTVATTPPRRYAHGPLRSLPTRNPRAPLWGRWHSPPHPIHQFRLRTRRDAKIANCRRLTCRTARAAGGSGHGWLRPKGCRCGSSRGVARTRRRWLPCSSCSWWPWASPFSISGPGVPSRYGPRRSNGPPPLSTSPPATAAGASGSAGAASRELVVDVAGKVRHPGIHRLPAGSRVTDALRAAGGVLHGASTRGLNQARLLADGEQIVVGVVGAPGGAAGGSGAGSVTGAGEAGVGGVGGGGPGSGGGPSAPISLSTATEGQLDTLPGVGPVLARHIVEFRSAHGGFTSVDQLRQVTGIGDRRFADLRPLVQP
ncbi:helix-hairpin-helix domain-containing protein [Streptomyces sp. NPDC017993]|uniref:helix-hairpin-helix domain-containing protein n=1 Tax=Streptomyces sp. NPDC017993 TaxID=3365027 RepID=UPI0037BA8FEC